MKQNNYTEHNSEMWDNWAKDGYEWSVPIPHNDFLAAQQGKLELLLTPETFVPLHWYPALKHCNVLGLASGGGQQMPVFAAHGAHVTLFDYSDAQLEADRMVAEREQYPIEIIKGDMTKPLPFANNTFDLVFHPVSNSYVQEVEPIWKECYRILNKGGILLAGFANPSIYMFPEDDSKGKKPFEIRYSLPFDPVINPLHAETIAANGYQFSHSLEAQIGGQLKAGFRLTDLFEDSHQKDPLNQFLKPYIATRAIKE